MSRYFIGVDSGTQGTKSILFDGETGEVVAGASRSYGLIEGLGAGCKEQNPSDWVWAMRETITELLSKRGIDRSRVAGIGVSGQQHGLVALDDRNEVIRAAKLWCDTSTSEECAEIISALGGLEKTIDCVGNGLPAGFTASKILWMKKHEPDNYRRLAKILLPHDYLNYVLTGEFVTECGDASGTGLFDVRQRSWSMEAIRAVDAGLAALLPALVGAEQPIGTLRAELAVEWGLPPGVIVSPGGGDNMMGAIGTGNIQDGVVTVSLGTSGTIYACSSKPVIDPQGEVAAFCDSTGHWLPLVCTMNVTVATEMVRRQFSLSHDELAAAAEVTPAGNDGLLLVPFFEGERTPNVPDGTGVYIGLREQTYTTPHFARAAMEGTTLGLNYGLNRLRELGVSPREIRATGGGARNRVWCQILADTFETEVVGVDSEEGAALGAALQAFWVSRRIAGGTESVKEICERFVRLDESTRVRPEPAHAERYRQMQQIHNRLVRDLGPSFTAHRHLITG